MCSCVCYVYVCSGGLPRSTLGILLGVFISGFAFTALVVIIIGTAMVLGSRMENPDADKSVESQRSQFSSTQTSPRQSPERINLEVNALPADSTDKMESQL